MDLFRPDLARTFLPGFSALPLADRDIFFTCKSSIHTIAWFLLIVVVALCRKSRRQSPIRMWIRCTLLLAFCQFWLNWILRLSARCERRNWASCFLKLFSGATKLPSLKVAKRAIPISIPTAPAALGTGCSTSRTVWMLAYHFPPDALNVMFLGTPNTSRLLRYRTQPSFGNLIRLLIWSTWNCFASG